MLPQGLESGNGSVEVVLPILILKQKVVAHILRLSLTAPLLVLSVRQAKKCPIDQLPQRGSQIRPPLLSVAILKDILIIDGIGGVLVHSGEPIEVEAIGIPAGVAILLQISHRPLPAQILLLLACMVRSLRKMKSSSSSRSCPKSLAYNSSSLCYYYWERTLTTLVRLDRLDIACKCNYMIINQHINEM